MNIIFILDSKFFRDRPPKFLFDMFDHYKKNSENRVTIIWTDHWRKFNKRKIMTMNPKIIIFGGIDTLSFGKDFEYVFGLEVHISYIGTDLFYFDECSKCSYIKKCNSIIHLGKCSKLIEKYREVFPDKKILNTKSRYVNVERYKDYHLDKKYEIFLYGSRGDFYPLRVKLEKIVKKKYNVFSLPSAGGSMKNITCNETLSKLINQSYLTMATTGRLESICFFKYNEIPASNSFLIGDIPEDYRDLYEGNIVEITLEMDEETIIKKIDEALSDKEKLVEKTKIFGEKIRRDHNLDGFVKEMDEIIKDLL